MDQQPAPVNPNPTDAPAPAAATAPVAEQPTVPETWPGAWGVYKFSKAVVKRNLGPLVILYVLNLVLSGAIQGSDRHGKGSPLILPVELIAILFSLVTYILYLAGTRGETLSLGAAFKRASVMLYLKLIGSFIVVGLLAGLSLLLLIIPFFFVLPRLVLAPYFVIDKALGPIEAVKQSWATTKGHAGKVWGIIGATIAMALLFVTIIGIPFALYFLFMYGAAMVLLYEYLTQGQSSVAPVGVTPDSSSVVPQSAPTPVEPVPIDPTDPTAG